MKKPLPPTFFWSGILFIILIHFIFPFKIIHFPYTLFGILFIILGIILNGMTDKLFKRFNTSVKPFDKPSHFIVKGPFKITRNPMYLGMFLILLGVCVLFGEPFGAIFALGFLIIMDRLFIPLEERNLEKRFGKEYSEYRDKVRRWI
jgi:protein-S-isoprenylcysteine O-methyltransferase Ste14